MAAPRRTRSRPLVATVFGTRPQYIKLAALWRALESRFRSILIDSGQHYDWEMAGVFRAEAGMRSPDLHLGIAASSAASQIGRLADALDAALAKRRPDAVVVIGDTSTTAGAAIAAAYRGIPLAHVEAGLRSGNRSAPEEKNRIIADQLSQWRFCPTQSAMRNLRHEGMSTGVIGAGDLMYEQWRVWATRRRSQPQALPFDLTVGEYYFVTAHRAENVDSTARLMLLVEILTKLDRPIVYPVHPRTRKNLISAGLWNRLRRMNMLRLLAPLPHEASLSLAAGARAVLTDSGGVQREAYWSGVPGLILRESTEWWELLSSGAGRLVGLDWKRVSKALASRRRVTRAVDPVFRLRLPSECIAKRLHADLT